MFRGGIRAGLERGAGWIAERRERLLRFESRAVGIVALDAAEFGFRSQFGVPIAVFTTVNAGVPIPIGGPVTFGAEQNGIRLGNLRSVIIDKGAPVCGMMAIEAKAIVPVIEMDLLMFAHRPIVMPTCGEKAVAFHAVVRPSVSDKVESFCCPRRCFVQVTVFRRSDNRLAGRRPFNRGQIRKPIRLA